MTGHLATAVSEADMLTDRLNDTLEADDELKVTEDEIENRVNNILSNVRQHNDELAERRMEEEDG